MMVKSVTTVKQIGSVNLTQMVKQDGRYKAEQANRYDIANGSSQRSRHIVGIHLVFLSQQYNSDEHEVCDW